MGRADLIGNGKRHLVPTWQPRGTGGGQSRGRGEAGGKVFLTRHTGLPKTPSTGRKGKAGGRRRRGGPAPR